MKYISSLTNLQAYKSVRQTSLTISGALCTVGGLIADVMQPLAPFVLYIFALSLMALLLLCAFYFKGKKELLGALVLSAMATSATGMITVLQTGGDDSEERGIVASALPAVALMQDRLGLIEEKLDDIKADTQTIKASSARIEEKSDQILAEIKKSGGSSNGIIKNPTKPEDYYHNARIQELGGDYSGARRSYLEYFKSDSGMLDPHLRFITFLKVQEGTSGARETYNEVTHRSTGSIPSYARLLLLPTGKRIAGLKSYFAANPKFAPVAYHLSLEYSERRLGNQTIGDQREELKYLDAFQQRDADGGLLRYFIDQDLVAQWRADASQRLSALKNSLSSGLLENPVSLSWMSHNAGWNGNITIGEPVLEVRWQIKGKGVPQATGLSGSNDPRTGRPAPRMFFELPRNQKNATIRLWYTDLQGVQRGPFDFKFEKEKESDSGNRRILEMTTTSWVSFRDNNGSTLLYFTHLLSYRGALEKIEYGLNRAQPNKTFKFPAWKKTGIAPINAGMKMYLKVPKSTQYVTIRLSYKNGGSKSGIVRFDR